MKAKRSIDTDVIPHTSPSEIRMILSRPTDERFHCLFDAFREGFPLDEIVQLTSIIPFFLEKIKNIVDLEKHLVTHHEPRDILAAKRYGFSNAEIVKTHRAVQLKRLKNLAGLPTYKMVDTCAAEFPANTPYFYSTFEQSL